MFFTGLYTRTVLLNSLILSITFNIALFCYYHDQFTFKKMPKQEYLNLSPRSIKSMDVYEYEHVHKSKTANFTVGFPAKKKRSAYLLITLYRSGSTLTGEMFNRNKNFMYYFEPLAIFGTNELPKQKLKMLNETFHCAPPIAENYKNFAPKDASTTKNCLTEGVCMFQLSTRFCQPPFCWKKDAPLTQCKKQCESPGKQPAKYSYMEKVCKNEVDTVAVKTIRFLDLKKLKPFYSEAYPMKFRAVMLVRDPRSMYHSRKKIFVTLNNGNSKEMGVFLKTLHKECQIMAENHHALEANENIRAKTFPLRYEDIARDPMGYAKKIYKFIGEDFTTEIEEMLHKAVAPPTKKLDKSKATYTTNREINETQIMNSWRLDKYISQKELSDIEKGCREMMAIYGYLPMGDRDRNDLSIDSVDKTHSVYDSVFGL